MLADCLIMHLLPISFLRPKGLSVDQRHNPWARFGASIMSIHSILGALLCLDVLSDVSSRGHYIYCVQEEGL